MLLVMHLHLRIPIDVKTITICALARLLYDFDGPSRRSVCVFNDTFSLRLMVECAFQHSDCAFVQLKSALLHCL